MKVTKQQVLRYLAGFNAEVEAERRRVAEENRRHGYRMLAVFEEYGPSLYAALGMEIPEAVRLVTRYGPEEVERALPGDEDAVDALIEE